MVFFSQLFSNEKSETVEEDGRVSCEYVAELIRQRASQFTSGQGMALVLLEVCKVKIFFFNGQAKISWSYNNHQLSTDKIGEATMEGSPVKKILKINDELRLVKVIKKQFRSHEVSIQPLWHLDSSAPDYKMMKTMHGDDVGIRVSFE